MTVYLEHWPRERFEVTFPVCDLCSTPITKFPCPVIHQPFDYILIAGRRSHVMKGGMALCESCFPKVMSEFRQRGEEVILR
jgi:hypothetical protein